MSRITLPCCARWECLSWGVQHICLTFVLSHTVDCRTNCVVANLSISLNEILLIKMTTGEEVLSSMELQEAGAVNENRGSKKMPVGNVHQDGG